MIYPMTESLMRTIKRFKITEEEMKSYKPGRLWCPLSRRWDDDPTADRDDIDHSTDEEVELTPVMLLRSDLIDRPTFNRMIKGYSRPGSKYFSELPQEEQEFIEKCFAEFEEEDSREKEGDEKR